MNFIPTNDVFHHICNLQNLNNPDELIEIFKSQNIEASKAKIKSWQIKTGEHKRGYRPMPREALDAFISELYERNLSSR